MILFQSEIHSHLGSRLVDINLNFSIEWIHLPANITFKGELNYNEFSKDL